MSILQPVQASASPPLRTAAHSMLAYGVISSACWWLTRRYAVEDGGSLLWAIAIAASIGLIALGALLSVGGVRFQRIARNYLIVLIVGGFVLPNFVSRPSAVSAFTIVSSAGLLLLVWGKPGRFRTILGYSTLVACTLLLVVGFGRKLQRPPLKGPAVVFEVMQVDEDIDLFRNAEPLPVGASIQTETIDGRQRRYMTFSAPADSPLAALLGTATGWVKDHIRVPDGVRVGWSRQQQEAGMVIRSYCLREPAFITTADVKGADVFTEKETKGLNLAITLTEPAADRFRDVTRHHIGRRLAVLFDGFVQIAPIVRSEISGGHVTVTLGQGATREEAEGLAAGLRGELLHGP